MDAPEDLRELYANYSNPLRCGLDNQVVVQLIERIAALQAENERLKSQSLLRSATTQTINGCYCKPGQCMAPIIMGIQMPCLDPEKAARSANQKEQ